ncbi:ribosomal large subunit pseudouridine synthase D [Candidatus Omnitrophus magneticus]|uniref:Pseudouridine synthase n=1 Tax=Candidatus Omnitrophus magneticus TaxID=1609969 RepID=A0A0F0CU85_9BACT|nr:ribosomal large subunit pseudouridine synthase D [Candidatus Omnitrophus magneticus]
MEEFKFIVTADFAGVRLDKYVALNLGEGYSRVLVKNLLDQNLILLDGKKVKASYHVEEGETVTVTVTDKEESKIEPENIPLKIIYEDNSFLVIDKPSGMIVHPGAGNKHGTLVNAVLYHCKNLPIISDSARPGIVHRLDKETSGIVLVAKTEKAMRSLSKQFQKRTVKKEYVALVKGVVEFDNGIIDAPLARNLSDRHKMEIAPETGKPAQTIYHVVKRFKDFTYLRIELKTGRTHQIRVHMKHLGHPVLGDIVYSAREGFNRQMLHAEKIGFYHPETCKYMEFISPIPPDIMEVIERGKIGVKK